MPEFSTPVSQKNFFKGDKVQLKWNQRGTELIVLAQTEVDKTGKSYYGETTLYLLSVNGGSDSRIDLGTLRPSLSVVGDYRLTFFGRKGWADPRRDVVAELEGIRRRIRIYACKNDTVRHSRPSYTQLCA